MPKIPCLNLFGAFHSGCLSNSINALITFKYPINSTTEYFGGIRTLRWIWSEYTALSTIAILLFGSNEGRCAYYRLYRGNIPDIKTIDNFVDVTKAMGYNFRRMVLDRGLQLQQPPSAVP